MAKKLVNNLFDKQFGAKTGLDQIKEFIQTAYKKLTGSIKDLLNFLGITISIGDYSLYANLSYGDL